MSAENIQKKIDLILSDLQTQTGVSDDELTELKKILDLTNFSIELD
tara:strand:+ start:150 stop:287 length:138 start_codon:yes stop_codon:yes gene_type:complete